MSLSGHSRKLEMRCIERRREGEIGLAAALLLMVA
jgi:hypothetical protein